MHKITDILVSILVFIVSLILEYAITAFAIYLLSICFNFEWSIMLTTGVFIVVKYIHIMFGGKSVSPN